MCKAAEISGVQDGVEKYRVSVHEYDKWLANFNIGITDNIDRKGHASSCCLGCKILTVTMNSSIRKR